MKVGIIALDYMPGHMGGIETYFLDLLVNMQRVDSPNEYLIFLNHQGYNRVSIQNPAFKKVLVRRGQISKIANRIYRYTTGKELLISQIGRFKCDIWHFPFQVISPRGLNGKKIVSFMDIQQEYYPEYFSPADLISREKSFPYSARNADCIIAISGFTKQSLIEKYKIPPKKIKVIHLAHNTELFREDISDTLPPGLTLPKKYIYYPAASWPHKNHTRLIRAFSIVSKEYPDLRLVLSGLSKQSSHTVDGLISSLGLNAKVVQLGFLPREYLPYVYRHALALIFPSEFEGFGIPLLEAMAVGCPVASSNTTSLPEVLGSAGIYFDPLDVEDIAAAIRNLAGDSGAREDLVNIGIKQARKFSNMKMATETIKLYEEINGS